MVHAGILKLDSEAIYFKHELSRKAVEESLSESKRQLLNEKVLTVLLSQENTEDYLARIIHHASVINDKEIIIKYSPLQLNRLRFNAHMLAANHYQNALILLMIFNLDKTVGTL